MMKKHNSRISITFKILALFVAALIILSLCGCYRSHFYKKYKSGDGSFSDLTFEMPDFDRFETVMTQLEQNKDKWYRAVRVNSLFSEAFDLVNDMIAMEGLAEVLSLIDVTDSGIRDALATIREYRLEAQERLWKMSDDLCRSGGGWLTRTVNSMDTILNSFGGSYYDRHNSEILKIQKNTSDIMSDYSLLNSLEYTVDAINADFLYEIPDGAKNITVNPDGSRSWLLTEDEILLLKSQGYICDETASGLIGSIYKDRAEDYGNILIKLVLERKKLAKAYGYDSFRKFAYETIHGRPYDENEIASLREAVKNDVVPLLSSCISGLSRDLVSKADRLAADIFSDDLVARTGKVLEAVDPSFKEIIDDMVKKELINWKYSPVKMDVSFTTVFPCYDIPFIFIQPGVVPKFSDVEDFFHEFGHYYHFKKVSDASFLSDLDSSEVMSQTLELLSLKHYGLLFDDRDVCEALYNYKIAEKLSTVISSFMIDEFESRLYEESDLDPDKIADIYYGLLEDYGLLSLNQAEYLKYEWSVIYHVFEEPFYYQSYATSSLVSMEIFLTEEPVKTYNDFCMNTKNNDILKNCSLCGLMNPLSKDSLKSITEKFASTKFN